MYTCLLRATIYWTFALTDACNHISLGISPYWTLFSTNMLVCTSALGYRGEACQHLDLEPVGLEVKGRFRIRKVQPEVWCRRK
jgi:hypothetical protein